MKPKELQETEDAHHFVFEEKNRQLTVGLSLSSGLKFGRTRQVQSYLIIR